MKALSEKLMKNFIWNISGDFGKAKNEKSEIYEINSECIDYDGVYRFKGEFKNISRQTITLNCLKAVFNMGGGEFEIYTQSNIWQNESKGMWQPLNTDVGVFSRGIRTAYGAAPFMAVYNNQTGRGVVFHLLADYAWQINARVVPSYGEYSDTIIELGVNSDGFAYKLETEKSINTPDIIFYEFKNKCDLDCRKLHEFCLKHFKRKQMPIIYNTWLSRFDNISYESVHKQIKKAAEIGAEYFVVDAGWFGNGENWDTCRGDWTENITGGFCGKLADISTEVNQCGMRFGLWFEIESADESAEIVKKHPEYFINPEGLYLLDFTNKKACEYILDVLCRNIEKYNIEFIKFNFNRDLTYSQTAYIDYYRGYEWVISQLKNKHPEIYLENCASGGLRADLKNCTVFDSFWLSDNQSPYEGMRIFKEGIKRLPPQCIEKWATLTSTENVFPIYGQKEMKRKIISTNDAEWNSVIGVNRNFLNGFLTGSPIGISCDLTKLSDKLTEELSAHIKKIKEEREFWGNAICSILTDTDKLLVLEYSDVKYDKIKIIVYSGKINQGNVFVYPHINNNTYYIMKNDVMHANEISENGIEIKLNGNYSMSMAELEIKNT